MKKTLCFILGTRPEIIKLFPLINEVRKKNIAFEIIHTGQHYSKELYLDIWNDLDLPPVTKSVVLKNHEAAAALGEMMEGLSIYLNQSSNVDRVVIVQGDTNSTLAGALVANKLKIPLVHIEAGFRSGLKTQPEEINRILVDQLSDLNFAVDDLCMKNLKSAQLSKSAVKTHNTAYAAANYIQSNLSLTHDKLFPFRMMTIHRAENADNLLRLKKILDLANSLAKELPLVWFIHPRTLPKLEKLLKRKITLQQELRKNNLATTELIFMPPQSYKQFFFYLSQCESIYSDSGGIVDEAIFLGKHYICLRSETEQLAALAKKRILLANPELSLKAILNKASAFEKKRFPKLSQNEKTKLVKAPVKVIEKIQRFF